MSQFEQYLIFGYAARAESFRKAAEAMGVSNSHISKQIAHLEQHLGYKLFHRNPRLHLTEAGQTLLPQVNSMLRAYEQLNHIAPALRGEPEGTVRIGLPPLLARELALPALAELLKEYPGLNLEISLQQSTLQAFSDKLDLVVTLGALPDSTLVCQRIASCEIVLAATPRYLARHGTPEHPEDLNRHRCLASQYPNFENRVPWVFNSISEPGYNVTVEISADVTSNDVYTVRSLVDRDVGIGVMPGFFIEDELDKGELLQVLKQYQFPEKAPIYIVFHDRELLTKPVSLVKDTLVTAIRDGLT